MKIFFETWTESEQGWGQHPDGCSVHLSKEDNAEYIREYWAKMPDSAPQEYSRPDGNGKYLDIPDDHSLAVSLKEKKSIRLWQNKMNELGLFNKSSVSH